MTVTEQDLTTLAAQLRQEFDEKLAAHAQERSVQILEAHNRCTHVGVEEVKRILEELGLPRPGLTEEEVRALIPDPAVFDRESFVADVLAAIPDPARYDDEELRGRILRVKAFADELADRIGAPRMEG